MSLTAQDVAEIIRLLDQSDFDSLDLEMGDLRLRLRRGEDGVAPEPPAAAPNPAAAAEPPADESPSPPLIGADAPDADLVDVPSPLLGIFYHAPKPGAAPFVEPGQRIEEDTIVGIVEVMKLMNSIRAGVRGTVIEIAAANAALVEYGEPLIRVRLDA